MGTGWKKIGGKCVIGILEYSCYIVAASWSCLRKVDWPLYIEIQEFGLFSLRDMEVGSVKYIYDFVFVILIFALNSEDGSNKS